MIFQKPIRPMSITSFPLLNDFGRVVNWNDVIDIGRFVLAVPAEFVESVVYICYELN